MTHPADSPYALTCRKTSSRIADNALMKTLLNLKPLFWHPLSAYHYGNKHSRNKQYRLFARAQVT